jgi:hypothetical protein
VKDIGSGNFGVAKLMKHKATGDMVAVKFIERGEKVRCDGRHVMKVMMLHVVGVCCPSNANACVC